MDRGDGPDGGGETKACRQEGGAAGAEEGDGDDAHGKAESDDDDYSQKRGAEGAEEGGDHNGANGDDHDNGDDKVDDEKKDDLTLIPTDVGEIPKDGRRGPIKAKQILGVASWRKKTERICQCSQFKSPTMMYRSHIEALVV